MHLNLEPGLVAVHFVKEFVVSRKNSFVSSICSKLFAFELGTELEYAVLVDSLLMTFGLSWSLSGWRNRQF